MLTHVRIVGNSATSQGGGIWALDSRVTLTHSTIARNSAAAEAGGIQNRTGLLTLTSSTVTGNSAGGDGGGILSDDRFTGAALTLTNSTISGNSAGSRGGGIFIPGSESANVTLTNSTVARNSADLDGGGIALAGDFFFLRLANSLVAQNSAPAAPDVRSDRRSGNTAVIARFNLIGDGTGSGITNTDGNQVGNAGAPIDPQLAPWRATAGPPRRTGSCRGVLRSMPPRHRTVR